MVESPARSDKDTTRKVPPEALLEAIEKVLPTFRGNPGNLQAVYRACIEGGHLRRDQVAHNTFRRHVKKFELLKDAGGLLEGPARKARLAFAKAHANGMWQGDTLHGPYLTIEGKAMKTYLICFIDDASRVIPHGEFYLADSTPRLIDCFQTALFKRGVPRSIYVDNGHRLGRGHLPPVRAGHPRHEALDRFGLDLRRQRFLTPSPYNKELFYLEESRKVRADNTFNLKGR